MTPTMERVMSDIKKNFKCTRQAGESEQSEVGFDALNSRLHEVLIRQVGDTRECPCCGKSFIPRDRTSEMAHELYKELFG